MPKKKRYYDKKMEKRDGAMIKGPYGIALMPTNVVMSYYPKDGSYLPENLNDGMSGIDQQKRSEHSNTMKELSPSKY